MYKYMMEHEAYIKKLLMSEEQQDWVRIQEYHRAQIEFMQHEREVHLIITLTFALFLLGSIVTAILIEEILFIVLSFILLVVELFYIVHYFRLENGVQRWYSLYNQIEDKLSKHAQQREPLSS